MKNILLSLSIPTYSRADRLEECLESIKIQFDINPNLQDMLEIVISDNASTDHTSVIAEKYKHVFKNFSYVINESNVGFDRNVLNVVKHSSGVYCWYIADDDVVVNGAIDYVVEKLKTNEYDIITVESSPIVKENYYDREVFNNTDIFETRNCDDFYHGNESLGAVSNLIFNRELWLKCLDLNDYLEYWLYYEVVLKMFVATDKKMLNVLQKLVHTGQDCRWSENGAELTTFINSNLLLERLIQFGFNKKKITDILERNRKRLPMILLRAKGHGLRCNLKNLKNMYKKMGRVGIFYLTLATLIYFIPNQIIILVRDSKKHILRLVK